MKTATAGGRSGSIFARGRQFLWARCIGAAAFRRGVSLSRHYHRQDARGSLSAGRLSLFFEQGGSAARSKQITNDNSEQQQQRNAPEHQRRSPRLQRALRDKE